MRITPQRLLAAATVTAAATLAIVACADQAPVAPIREATPQSAVAALPVMANLETALAEIRRVTARYHDVNAAIADGFVQVSECENFGAAGPIGIVYANVANLLDGQIDPSKPDGILYELGKNGQLTLTAAEFAIAGGAWTDPQPPQFFGTSFQYEDEFDVWGLHVWVWRHNPLGVFAVFNPNVSCAEEH